MAFTCATPCICFQSCSKTSFYAECYYFNKTGDSVSSAFLFAKVIFLILFKTGAFRTVDAALLDSLRLEFAQCAEAHPLPLVALHASSGPLLCRKIELLSGGLMPKQPYPSRFLRKFRKFGIGGPCSSIPPLYARYYDRWPSGSYNAFEMGHVAGSLLGVCPNSRLSPRFQSPVSRLTRVGMNMSNHHCAMCCRRARLQPTSSTSRQKIPSSKALARSCTHCSWTTQIRCESACSVSLHPESCCRCAMKLFS